MTFILSLGYYITPALVGGPRDQMVSNFISIYINRDLNWGMAAALGVVLLVVTLAIYLRCSCASSARTRSSWGDSNHVASFLRNAVGTSGTRLRRPVRRRRAGFS